MASIVAKRKGRQQYYYVVESARVDGRPRIVHQTYLGTAERLAALIQDRGAAVPLTATVRSFGLPGALWLAAERLGIREALTTVWPAPRSGPSPAHYLLLAAIHRSCAPGPKTAIGEWYRQSVLAKVWGYPADRFSSQAFWDCFEQLEPATLTADSALDRAQAVLLGRWRAQHVVSERLLAYDTTNFHTYIATTNARNQIAQRGHNKQGRHQLRQVGLSYVLDGESGLGLCHHVYPGNTPDVDEVATMLARIGTLLDGQQIPRGSVTLVMDKGAAALATTVAASEAGVGWVLALPWTQAPAALRDAAVETLPVLRPGVRAQATRQLVHGAERLVVVKHSASFAAEQLQSLTTSLAKALQALRQLTHELAKPQARFTEAGLRRRIDRWLSGAFLRELIGYTLTRQARRWRLDYTLDQLALESLIAHRLGRTVLLTNRVEWTAAQVVAAYDGQQQIEQVFRGLKEGEWVGWGPMYHWTDRKIRVHAFYCVLGLSLLQTIYRQAQPVWPDLSMDRLLDELSRLHQVVLLYPPHAETGPVRTATVLSTQTQPQQALVTAFGLDRLHERTR